METNHALKILVAAIALFFVWPAQAGAQFGTDTAVDLACSSPMLRTYVPVCTAAVQDDIITASPRVVQEDIYQKSLIQDSRIEQTIKESESMTDRTYGLSMSEAKITALENLNNGTKLPKTYNRTQRKISEAYSLQTQSLLAKHNRDVQTLKLVVDRVKSTGGLSMKDVFSINLSQSWQVKQIRFGTENFRLPNKTQMQVLTVDIEVKRGCCKYYQTYESTAFANASPHTYALQAHSPNRSSFAKVTDPQKYNAAYGKIIQNYENAKASSARITRQIYRNYQQGTVDVANVTGPLEKLKHMSTTYQESGATSYEASVFQQMGIPTNTSLSFDITTVFNGTPKTVESQLFAPKGQFKNNEIKSGYNYSTNNRTVFILYKAANNKIKRKTVQDWFVAESIENPRSGRSLDSARIQKVGLATSKATNLSTQIVNGERTPRPWKPPNQGSHPDLTTFILLSGALTAILLLFLRTRKNRH